MGALGLMYVVIVPMTMSVLMYFHLKQHMEGTKQRMFAAECAVAILSYMTTRLVVGIYDICVSTLFVCVMRDCDHYGGKYMTDRLAAVCDVPDYIRATSSFQVVTPTREL